MNATRPALGSPPLRLAAFAALAALAAAQWMPLVEEPPAGRVALAVCLLVAGAAALVLIAARRPGRTAARTLGVLTALVATAAGLVAVGVPARLLEPASWGALASGLGRGFSGLAGDVDYPYHGATEWSRIVILAGLPVALGIAAALAFWPRGDSTRARRTAPLVVIAASFGVGATVVVPERPLLWGFLLLLGIVAWLWLPSLSPRDAIAGTALVAVAGALALPLAGALDHDGPWIDFREWEFGRDAPNTFDWNHSYGALDWPRDGTALAAIESDEPHYWKTAVLDEFDGTRWLRSERSTGERLELPTQVEGGRVGATLQQANSEWIETMDITIGPMQSEFVLGAGALVTVQDLNGLRAPPDGTIVKDGAPLQEGDSYSAIAYAPDPSPRQLRAAPDRYPPDLARYTEITLPGRPEPGRQQFVTPAPYTPVQVPLRGSGGPGGDRAASRAIASSPYASTYRLAHRLAAGESTAYGAATSIERHLQSGFTYNESPPARKHPLPAFLFRDRIGYCQQFSGAMALMLRMDGVPSRVVSGFSPGSPDPDDKHRYLVEDLDAHSWVEAYFPTIGWVTFDPTPPSAPATGRTSDTELASAGNRLDFGSIQGTSRKEFRPSRGAVTAPGTSDSLIPLWILPAGIALLGLIGLAVAATTTALRRLRYRSLSPAARADAHLRELAPALARLDWPLAPGETLLALERRLHRYRKLAAARYAAKLRAGRFSSTNPDTPTLADRRALRDDVTGRNGLRSLLRGLVALPPGGPK